TLLLVGQGDFPFFLGKDVVVQNYKKAKSNMKTLEKLGALLLHGVDATKMKLHTYLSMHKFDRIIYNFPHAGFYGKEDSPHVIKMHRNLVHGFLKNASGMLQANGEIHVSHKTTAPFSQWNIQELTVWNSLVLDECSSFKIETYPGYKHKRGSGVRCDKPFPLGMCSTFKFKLTSAANKMIGAKKN
ncbi:hypothetical protein RJ639_015749, partial [Escallonia herrerae]